MAVTGVAYVSGAGVANDPACVERACSRACGVTFYIAAADAAKHDAAPPRDRVCYVCALATNARRKAAAKKAHDTKLASGTNFVSAWWLKKPWLPSWLAHREDRRTDKTVSCQAVLARDRLVYTPQRVPLILLDEETFDVVEWLTLDRLKALWPIISQPSRQRDLFGQKLVIAPESARISGEIPPQEAAS